MITTLPIFSNSLNQIDKQREEDMIKTMNDLSFLNQKNTENVIYANFNGNNKNSYNKKHFIFKKAINLKDNTKQYKHTPASSTDSMTIMQFNPVNPPQIASQAFSLKNSIVSERIEIIDSPQIFHQPSLFKGNAQKKLIVPSFSVDHIELNNEDVKYKEVMNYFVSYFMISQVLNTSIKIYGNNNQVPVITPIKKVCCLTKFLHKFLKKYKLNDSLIQDKDFIFFMSNSVFISTEIIYLRIALMIYKSIDVKIDLSKEQGDNVNHISLIEFLKKYNPLFPIIKGGMFTLSLIIMLIDKYPSFVKDISCLCKDDSNNKTYIFELIASIAVLCINYLHEKELNIYFNKNENVLETINNFFIGLLYQVILYIRKSENAKISYNIIKEAIGSVQEETCQSFTTVFWKCMQFKEKYAEKRDSISLTISEAYPHQ